MKVKGGLLWRWKRKGKRKGGMGIQKLNRSRYITCMCGNVMMKSLTRYNLIYTPKKGISGMDKKIS
jgi:hypothetical protein